MKRDEKVSRGGRPQSVLEDLQLGMQVLCEEMHLLGLVYPIVRTRSSSRSELPCEEKGVKCAEMTGVTTDEELMN